MRVALIDGQWVAFPNFTDAERSVFDMVVAGRVVQTTTADDVAIMMVEAESTEATWDLVKNEGMQAPTEEVVAEGLEASKKFIKPRCARPRPSSPPRPPSRSRTSRSSWTTRTTCTPPSRPPPPPT